MVNHNGLNGHQNGMPPSDDALSTALHDFARRQLTVQERLAYLQQQFGYSIRKSKLMTLNKKFNVPTVKKPPPDHVAFTLVAEKVGQNVSGRNGPRTLQRQIALQDQVLIPRDKVRKIQVSIDPAGFTRRFPGSRAPPKPRRQLQDTGVYYELHFDGHEKLNHKALGMGTVSIDIYGVRDHSSGKIFRLTAVPDARCDATVGHFYLDLVETHGCEQMIFLHCHDFFLTSARVFIQATTDKGNELGHLRKAHLSLRDTLLPDLHDVPAFVQLKSTDNLPIERIWDLLRQVVGYDLKEIIFLGKQERYFDPSLQSHVDLFHWIWPKIVQDCLDKFVDYWNNHRIRRQNTKGLPSGAAPNLVFDFPENYGLVNCSVPVPSSEIDILRSTIPKSREECCRWVSEEFDRAATEIYQYLGSPSLDLLNGWTVFTQMVDYVPA